MPRLQIPRSSSVYPEDVSPVESNEGFQSRARSPDVSPITDPTSAPSELNQGRNNSQNGVSKRGQMFGGAGTLFSRKIRPSTLDSPDRDSSATNVTRWDDFSGEQTASEKGKPASTSPDAVRLNVEAKYGRRKDSLGNSVMISGPKSTGLRKTSGNRSPWVPPGWKGAGGRHPIVNPMVDKPLPPGKTPTFPAGSHQRSASKDHDTDTIAPHDGCGPLPSLETKEPSRVAEHEYIARTSSPYHTSDKDLPHLQTASVRQQPTPPAESPQSVELPDDIRSPLARNPSHGELVEESPPIPLNPPTPPELTPIATAAYGKSGGPEAAAHYQRFNIDTQPPSRFSATTFATTIYDSPPATPEMHQDESMKSPTSSILDRKRPIPPAGVALSAKVTARKPTPSQMNTMKKAEENSRYSKTLPKEPPEEQKVSRVESLQAKLDALRRRRGNLQTVIHELTNVVQPSSIAYDMASRQEIRRTFQGLSKSVSDVVKDEHEMGLTLHRAYKRQDDTAYEPTHLWVRRVTS